MTNEEKAKELSHDYFRRGQLRLVSPDSESAGYKCAMEMAEWKDDSFKLKQKEICCANCANLKVVNSDRLYAYCEEWLWKFEPFEADTRTTKCGRFEKEN